MGRNKSKYKRPNKGKGSQTSTQAGDANASASASAYPAPLPAPETPYDTTELKKALPLSTKLSQDKQWDRSYRLIAFSSSTTENVYRKVEIPTSTNETTHEWLYFTRQYSNGELWAHRDNNPPAFFPGTQDDIQFELDEDASQWKQVPHKKYQLQSVNISISELYMLRLMVDEELWNWLSPHVQARITSTASLAIQASWQRFQMTKSHFGLPTHHLGQFYALLDCLTEAESTLSGGGLEDHTLELVLRMIVGYDANTRENDRVMLRESLGAGMENVQWVQYVMENRDERVDMYVGVESEMEKYSWAFE